MDQAVRGLAPFLSSFCRRSAAILNNKQKIIMEGFDDLLLHLTGVDEDKENYEELIEEKLAEEFNMDRSIFENLMEKTS